MPRCNFELHEDDSPLVETMNKKLNQDGQLAFVEFYEGQAKKWHRTYLMEVSLKYSHHIQPFLADFVPTVSRRKVEIDELSPIQKEFAQRIGHKPSTKNPIIVSDFHPQTTILTIEYLGLLTRLGVTCTQIHGVFTAFSESYFRPSMEKMLRLKSCASNDYFRLLAKLLCNSGYGSYRIVSCSRYL